MSKTNKRLALIAAAALAVVSFASTSAVQAETLRVRVTEADLASEGAIAARAAVIASRYCGDERRLEPRARCEAGVRTETVAQLGAFRHQRMAALSAKSGGGAGSLQTAALR